MTIRLSEEAAEQLDDILNYLEEKWSVRSRNNFIDKLEDSFDSIITFPTGYPKSEKYPVTKMRYQSSNYRLLSHPRKLYRNRLHYQCQPK